MKDHGMSERFAIKSQHLYFGPNSLNKWNSCYRFWY